MLPKLGINDLELLRANPRFLFGECLERGIEVSVLDWENESFIGQYRGHSELFQDIDGSIMPYSASVIAGSKSLTKRLLEVKGLNTPKGIRCLPKESADALSRAKVLTPPLVIKPTNGSGGKYVYSDLYDDTELEFALGRIFQAIDNREVLIEEQQSGQDIRVFITKKGAFAALHREPAHVIGDGISTIEILARNESYKRMNPRINCLGEIIIDEDVDTYLKRQGRTINTVLDVNEKAYLRQVSNVSLGGVAHDITDLIHPGFIKISIEALKAMPGLPYAGIDIMAEDYTADPEESGYSIIEINSVPGIGMHIAPGTGAARNVAAMIVDLLFPETIKSKNNIFKTGEDKTINEIRSI